MYGQDIHIIRSRTHYLNLRLQNADGTAYTLQSGEKVIFGVKKNPDEDSSYVIKKTLTSTSLVSDYYLLTLNPIDTESIEPGLYYYDMGLQRGNDYFSVIPLSRFYIDSNVTVKES